MNDVTDVQHLLPPDPETSPQATPNASPTLSELIGSLSELRRNKKSLESDLKNLDKMISEVEHTIVDVMDRDGVIEAKSSVGKVSLQAPVYPHVENWDQVWEFILENRYMHLLEKRMAVLAYRELIDLGRPVPGVLPFTKRKLSFKES